MKIGDLVYIDPVFFGYDNVPPEWENSLFIIINMKQDVKRMIESYHICTVLTPQGGLYDFYDYELRDCFSGLDVFLL